MSSAGVYAGRREFRQGVGREHAAYLGDWLEESD